MNRDKDNGEMSKNATSTEEFSETRDFGDDGDEGGSVKPNADLVVRESIVGKWQSQDDKDFVREFKTGGKVTDWYNNEEVLNGTFKVFTSVNPPASVPQAMVLVENRVYIQITEPSGETYHFRLEKLTPEELELTYLDRGGVLHFRMVK